MEGVIEFINKYLQLYHLPSIGVIDVLEIIILAALIYQILRWIKNTRAWVPVRGVVVLLAFILIAYCLQMHTIIWLVDKLAQVGLIGVVIIFQPELRRSLEELGRKRMIPIFSSSGRRKEGEDRFTEKTAGELVKGCFEMGRARTGALIVIQNEQPLNEYERTGIDVDGIVSSQLLINIFEHNTPLHDGAVIVRENRVTAATCYLPLSDNMALSKDLGTRHRAGVGISEATDSMTVIVSEETGKISVAFLGELSRGLDAEKLREKLRSIQNKAPEEKKRKLWKGRSKVE